MASPKLVGVDIQKLVGKIDRIVHKFMRDVEIDSVSSEFRLEHLHVYWGAKEALYKVYGRKQLDFREHIFIEPFSYDLEKGVCKGAIVKDDYRLECDLFYKKIDDYILVYGMESIGDLRLA
jgi:phosphopantetheinyl transferase